MGERDRDVKQDSEASSFPTDSVKAEQSQYDYSVQEPSFNGPLLGEKSPGVLRIEATSAHITRLDRVLIFLGIFLIAYAYGLDGLIRFTYQPEATAAFSAHSLLATINVVRAVVAAAAQPTAARIADVFGRVELILVSIFFYLLGTVIEAASNSVQSFAAGALFYQIGFTTIILLIQVIIADITSLKSRLFFSFIPNLPFLINTWVSGNITAAVLERSTWQWGIGMWAIIYPVCALPLIVMLSLVGRRARKAGSLDKHKSPFQLLGARKLAIALFWQLDVVGIILLIAVLGLILAPLTLAGGQTGSGQWRSASIVAPLVIGFLCIPAFVVWERNAKHPIVPFHLVKDRAVWAALGMVVMLNFAWAMQGDYLYTVLIVAFNQSILSATRIRSLYTFVSVVTGTLLGLVVLKVRRLKAFIVAGTTLFLVAFGLLIRYRGSPTTSEYAGVIGAQVLLGIAGGLFPYPGQASIQAATRHEHVAVITALYLTCYNIGLAFGNSVSGAIWTQMLPERLAQNLGSLDESEQLTTQAYSDPFTYATAWPVGTDERDGVIDAYRATQRILCITGICLCVPMIIFSGLLRDPKLGDEQSLPDAEGGKHSGVTKGSASKSKKGLWARFR